VVDQPEISFRHWCETIEIKPGKRTVLRDENRHFNDIIYSLMKLSQGGVRTDDPREEPIRIQEALSFTDREGVEHDNRLSIESSCSDITLVIICNLSYDGVTRSLPVTVQPNRETEHEIMNGKVKAEIDISSKYNRCEVDYSLWRTDIEQNMRR